MGGNHKLAQLLNLEHYKECPIPEDDPLRFYFNPLLKHFYHRRIDVSMSLIGRGKRVLEVGFGSGTSFLELSTRFTEIHGLDMHPYGAAVKNIFTSVGINVQICRASILHAPYAANSFDAILAISILEHLKSDYLPDVMMQIRKLLIPGGIFVVGMPGVNRMMSTMFKAMNVDITRQHLTCPNEAIEAASKIFHIDKIIKMPTYCSDRFLLYKWFRARNL